MRDNINCKLNKIFTGRDYFWPVFFVTIFFACLPLFTVNCINGHDVIYHLLRIEALKSGIAEGLPFLRINVLFLGGEGYASSLFYPDTLLYIPALLRLAGFSINSSYHIFIAVTIILGFLSAYFSAKIISADRFASLITAVVFTLAQYHLGDIYTRSAVGEFTALIFLPLIIAGLWDFSQNELRRPWLLISGMTGVILCHTLTTIFSLGLCLIIFIFNIRKTIKNPRIFLKLILSALFCLALTAFYYLPVIEQMASASFKYTKVSFDLNYEKLLLKDVFANQYKSMGIAVFIPLFSIFFIKHEKHRVIFADILTATGILFCLCSTGFFPWKRLASHLTFIQFPWRLFIIATPLLAFSSGIYLSEFLNESRDNRPLLRKGLLIAVLSVMAVSAVGNYSVNDEGYYSYSDDYFNYAPYTAEIIGGEWLPSSVSDRQKLVKDSNIAYTVDDGEIEVNRDRNSLSVDLSAYSGQYIDVPFVYYKGYKATDADGNALTIDGSGENGRIRVWLNGENYVKVYYAGTTIQVISDILSIFAWLAAIALIIRNKQQKTN